ncbi:VOC family protein [Arthrobacter sp. 35W]|uniref:VOC family protein n=1 Tax=Arthrobacter sp. 35W TaxID=1132441 RepID=UPI0003FD4D64|nr:VOC family protein [Arthrobacter sp. 35W]
MIYELNHFGILVEDIEASLDFYQKLDAKIVFDHTIDGLQVRIVYLQLAGGMIELIFVPVPSEATRFGIDHLAFMTDDLEGDYERLVRAGCSGDQAPKKAGTGNGTLAFLRRPDGARLELLERDVDFRVPDAGTGLVTRFDHYAYRVDDLAEAHEFFTKTIGMAALEDMSTAEGSFYNIGYDVLSLRTSAEEPDAFEHFGLRVDDVDRALATLAERGVQPIAPAAETPSGHGRNAFLADPDGVRIELLERPESSHP